MTLALALAALGYLVGWLAGRKNGYEAACRDANELVEMADPDSFIAVQRENAPWQ